ncbi:MAG: HAD hydrolase-like protein [Bacteroidales bacterium]|nr:HAD hydrolase-like protein [Bacteroidales bacterium]
MINKFFDAVIFDLDGVITKTALVHSAAWKKMFDDFLLDHSKKTGSPFVPFSHKDDYLPFVDGKPRYKGVADFLASRGIELPFGDVEDGNDKETVCGLGNRKNDAFNEVLRRDGVEVYPSTVSLMKELREKGYRVGVASSSKNCEGVLEAAGLTYLVETRVDGVVSATMGLKGKPEADIFTTAAANLGCSVERSIVVEDAVSGVQAGRKGNFGLVLGIAREENHSELISGGADFVVEDISEISLDSLNDWFEHGQNEDAWSVTYFDYDTKKERSREALLTVGNGYFGTRGAMEETSSNPVNYPATYMAGMYNRLSTPIAGRDIENEDFVNIPNWLPVTFRIDDGEWFDVNKTKIISIKRSIHFGNGLLERKMIVQDEQMHQTEIVSRRFVSMHNPLLAALQYEITPLNYSGKICIKSSLNGNHINDGVDRYKSLNQKHLEPVTQGRSGDAIFLVASTTQSNHQIALAARQQLIVDNTIMSITPQSDVSEGLVTEMFAVETAANIPVMLEKIVAICSDKESFIENAKNEALKALKTVRSFDQLLAESEDAWEKLWDRFDIQIEGDRMSQKLLRLHLFHLLVSVSPFNKQLDASITARGLHGEAYRGHIFWDELFILPLYDFQLPESARSMLMYRYNRLGEARNYARQYGYRGAMFPWQSGSDGREETQVIHLNPLTGDWGDDYSSLQRHVSLAIAYNIWDYYWISDDKPFLVKYGAEMFFEICRFWASKSIMNTKTGRFEIFNVMGPDEFHEHSDLCKDGGLKDNTYTNLMVSWLFNKADEIVEIVGEKAVSTLGFTTAERKKWLEISTKINLVTNDEGILAQYDGYFELKELDWDYYRQKYGNIYRLDRILKAEGKSADEFKVAKQADTLMTFYNINKSEVDHILEKLEYQVPADYLERNLNYYLQRTSHGSTLSRVVHARLAAMTGNTQLSWELYQDALGSDYVDIQGGTTGEGIHAGVMAGTILIALNTFAGINYREKYLSVNPVLPEQWKQMAFNLNFKGIHYEFKIKSDVIFVKANQMAVVLVADHEFALEADSWTTITY